MLRLPLASYHLSLSISHLSYPHHFFLRPVGTPICPVLCLSLSRNTHTHYTSHTLTALSRQRPCSFSADSAIIAISPLLNNSLQTLLSEHAHTHMLIYSRFTFIGTCVTHAHTRSLCLTPTCADRRARRGEDTCALTHVHTCMCTHTPTPTRMEPHCFSFPFGQNGTMGRFHYPV